MVLAFVRKAKTDEQIDSIQEGIADSLDLIETRMRRKIYRSMKVIELNDGKPYLIKRDMINLLMDLDYIKNLASELRVDARL